MPLVSVERSREATTVPTGEAPTDDVVDEPRSSKPPKDAIFEILKASRRRQVLRYLDAHGGEATIGALAEYIAAAENDIDRASITSSQRKRVYVGLYQSHLPKMDGYGAVDWDKDRGFVQLRDDSWWYLAYLYFDPTGSESSPDDGALAAILERLRRLASR